jgi:hypothetical protein
MPGILGKLGDGRPPGFHVEHSQDKNSDNVEENEIGVVDSSTWNTAATSHTWHLFRVKHKCVRQIPLTVFHVERRTNSTGRRVFHVKQVASLARFC